MQGLPTLTEQLYAKGREIFGKDCYTAEIGYKRVGDKGFWQAYLCILSPGSIFAQGATPQAAFEAGIAALNVHSAGNLEAVLGCKLVA